MNVEVRSDGKVAPAKAVLTLLVALALSGCGSDAVEREARELRRGVEARVAEARKEFDDRRERYGRRIQQVLGELERAFERPDRTSPSVRSRGRNGATTIDEFLTDILESVDRYWTRTFARARLPEPRVSYEWTAPGDRINLTGCGLNAGETSAFYCPADDTIYVGQQFAADIYNGVARGFPGEASGRGRAAGDFAVAYIVAHEYAHNLQQELGIFDNRASNAAKPYELQADCMSGAWAYSVYEAGELQPGDIEEAANAALAVGDFETQNADHHGTPDERRAALLDGFESGDPSVCSRYLPR